MIETFHTAFNSCSDSKELKANKHIQIAKWRWYKRHVQISHSSSLSALRILTKSGKFAISQTWEPMASCDPSHPGESSVLGERQNILSSLQTEAWTEVVDGKVETSLAI